MLIFGHLGITTGIVKVCDRLTLSRSTRYKDIIDYRMVMLGSMLPDVIDKPLGIIINGFKEYSGHLIAHTFIFSALLILLGFNLFIKHINKNILILGISSLIHQLFDMLMQLDNYLSLPNLEKGSSLIPRHLDFLHEQIANLYGAVPFLKDIKVYISGPYVYSSEIIGFLIIEYFFWKMVLNRDFGKFIKLGKL